MNVVFLTDNFPPESNAPANRTYEHARHWVLAGHSVTVITCAPNFPAGKVYPGYENKWHQVELMSGIRVVRVKTYMTANERFNRRVFDFLSFMVMGCIAAVLQKKPDVIIATSPQFFCGVAGMIASTIKRVPFILEVRDLWPDSIVALGVSPSRAGIKLLQWLEQKMYKKAALIIVVSKAFVQHIQEKVPNTNKIRIVTNGVEKTVFNAAQSLLPIPNEIEEKIKNKFVVAYIGTHGRAHGLLTILKTADECKHNKDIFFLLIGSGEKREELIEWSANRGQKNIAFLPLQSRELIPAFINSCDVALVPLRNLPIFRTVIPSKIFEYMAMGKPMVVSIPKGESTSIIEEHNCGIVVEPEDHIALSSAIMELQSNKDLLDSLGINAKKAVMHYDRSRKADEMMQHISDMLENTRKAC